MFPLSEFWCQRKVLPLFRCDHLNLFQCRHFVRPTIIIRARTFTHMYILPILYFSCRFRILEICMHSKTFHFNLVYNIVIGNYCCCWSGNSLIRWLERNRNIHHGFPMSMNVAFRESVSRWSNFRLCIVRFIKFPTNSFSPRESRRFATCVYSKNQERT